MMRYYKCDVVYMMFGILAVAVIWGVACSMMDKSTDHNLAYVVNTYMDDIDFYYYRVSRWLIKIPVEYRVFSVWWVTTIRVLSICMGLLVILYSVVGIVCFLLKLKNNLLVLTAFILVTTTLQVTFLGMLYDTDSILHNYVKHHLLDQLTRGYKLGANANAFSQLLNAAMVTYECCGIRSFQDFPNLTIPSQGDTEYLATSPACCNKQTWLDAVNNFDVLMDCAKYNQDINRRGCYDLVYETIFDVYIITFVAQLFLTIIWQCAIMVLSLAKACHCKSELHKDVALLALQLKIEVAAKKEEMLKGP